MNSSFFVWYNKKKNHEINRGLNHTNYKYKLAQKLFLFCQICFKNLFDSKGYPINFFIAMTKNN